MTSNVSEARPCPRCGVLRPWPAGYAIDRSKPSGRKSWCKPCDAAAVAERTAARVGAQLRLAPGREPDMRDAVEMLIGSLAPPAGPQDAVLVQALRAVAKLYEQSYGSGDVGAYCALSGQLIRLQRELAATRATKAKASAEPVAAPRGKFGAFRDATA